MTSFTTIFGVLPIAIGLGAGAESRRPLGIAVVGGLLCSTFLTLVLVPVVYTVLARFTEARETGSPAAAPVEGAAAGGRRRASWSLLAARRPPPRRLPPPGWLPAAAGSHPAHLVRLAPGIRLARSGARLPAGPALAPSWHWPCLEPPGRRRKRLTGRQTRASFALAPAALIVAAHAEEERVDHHHRETLPSRASSTSA
jgi:hypothetical protein